MYRLIACKVLLWHNSDTEYLLDTQGMYQINYTDLSG